MPDDPKRPPSARALGAPRIEARTSRHLADTDDNGGNGERTGSRAGQSVLLNGIGVLQSFSVDEPVLGVTEIARRVGLHKSTVSRTLATLEHAGLVERDAKTGRFQLGIGVIGLAGPLLANLDVRRVARSALEALTQRTQETSALTVWSGFEAVSVEQVASPRNVKHTSPVGTRYGTHASASVQVFLAHLPETQLRALLDRGLPQYSERTIVDVERYIARLDEVRRRGWAVNDGETSLEEIGLAAPVRDHRDDLVAAVLLSAPRFRVSGPLLTEYGTAVRQAADEVTARLGGRTPERVEAA
jgi:IclR family transcriptional regulator, acetate operon repressor